MHYMFPRVAVIQERSGESPLWGDRGQLDIEQPSDVETAENMYSKTLSSLLEMQFTGELRLAIFPIDKYGSRGSIPQLIIRYVDTVNRKRR